MLSALNSSPHTIISYGMFSPFPHPSNWPDADCEAHDEKAAHFHLLLALSSPSVIIPASARTFHRIHSRGFRRASLRLENTQRNVSSLVGGIRHELTPLPERLLHRLVLRVY
ncbi:hypothetical protein J6590_033319 [Homalodisca vitripennis]|nr:hypothetical protein J6590_033319 [Homalodisca vitripennis]